MIRRVLFGFAAVTAVAAWFGAHQTAAPRPPAAAPPPAPVTVGTATRRDVPAIIQALGTVQAFDTVAVQPRVTGQITEVQFTQGQEVKEGDPLFVVDPRPYQAALDQAQGQLQHDQAVLAEATTDLGRYRRLAAQNSIAQQQAQDQAYVAQQAAGQVKLDQAAVDNAALNLAYCHIGAPVAGRTGQRLVDLGNYVQSTGSTTLVTITQMKPIYVTFTIPATDLDRVRQQQARAPLEVDAYAQDGKRLAEGRVSLINNQVNTTTGTVLLEGTFANADEALWPGAFIDVRLDVAVRRAAVTVPEQTVMEGPDGTYVYTVEPDDTVRRVAVRVTARQDGIAVIDQGLTGGERVVVDGQYRLADKAKVQIAAAGAKG